MKTVRTWTWLNDWQRQHHLTNRIIHHGQARVAADEQLLGGNAQHLTEDHFAVGNTGKIPVVTAGHGRG